MPQSYPTHWKFAAATSYLSQSPHLLPALNGLAALCILTTALTALLRRKWLCRLLCIPTVILCVGLVMEFERIREFVRGPYLLPGYMYANQIPMAENLALAAGNQALLPRMRWINNAAGLSPESRDGCALFAANCGVCHTEDGINGIRERLAGRTLDGINAITGITQNLAPFMTPFSGSDQERLLLASYLYTLANRDSRLHQLDPREK